MNGLKMQCCDDGWIGCHPFRSPCEVCAKGLDVLETLLLNSEFTITPTGTHDHNAPIWEVYP